MKCLEFQSKLTKYINICEALNLLIINCGQLFELTLTLSDSNSRRRWGWRWRRRAATPSPSAAWASGSSTVRTRRRRPGLRPGPATADCCSPATATPRPRSPAASRTCCCAASATWGAAPAASGPRHRVPWRDVTWRSAFIMAVWVDKYLARRNIFTLNYFFEKYIKQPLFLYQFAFCQFIFSPL